MNSPQPWWLTWSVAEVAAAILPLFSYPPIAPYRAEMGAMKAIVTWCRTGALPAEMSHSDRRKQDGERQFEDPDIRAIAEAVQVLERAGLLMRAVQTSGGKGGSAYEASWVYVGLTRLGWHAVQTNGARRHLGLSDNPPMS
jgi:hypothetical protein